MEISIIVAAAENNTIGKNNQMPWRLSDDLKYFKAVTTGYPVVMGRKTFESLGKPLPGRQNIVITGNKDFALEGVTVVNSIEEAIDSVSEQDKVFIIGGEKIYRQFWDRAHKLYLTRVHTTVDGDTFIPAVSPDCWKEVSREFHKADPKNECDFSFITYTRP